MSEVEAQAPPPAEIVPSKSEDKLEIEKEENEGKQKAEDIVGDMFDSDKKTEETEKGTEEKPSEEKKDEKCEEKPAESSEAGEKQSTEKAEGDEEKKDEEKTESKEKKFNIPKIKTPKVIKEIRSRSKSREKKKNKDGENSGEGEAEAKKEGEGEASAEAAEGEEKKEDGEEKKDLVTEARAKVKDAMENINLPKMPKLHRPEFVKEYIKKPKDGEKTEGEDTAEKADENKEGETTEEKKEEPKGKAEEEETKEEEKSDEKVEGAEEKKDAEKKTSIIDSLKNIKSQVFPKKKEETSETDGEKPGEAEKLLEEKPEKKEDEEKEEPKDEKKEEKSKGASLLKSIRNVASGVPALFKKDATKEADVEAGEKDELLEKKETDSEKKPDDLKMEEIKLEDEKKEDGDEDEKDDEKKDPEKGEVIEEKCQLDRLKKLPGEALRQVSSLDRQKQYGLFGMAVGLLLLILIIIIAACVPGGWQSHHKLVEDGKWVETMTGCGKVLGWVEGEERFLFRSLPYSASVGRFEHSRLAKTLEECGEEMTQPANESTVCMRRLADGITGEEDCLSLDIATSSVVYDYPAPVVAYIGGDEPGLAPSAELAYSQGVVFVSIQVRQGILGYLSHSALSDTEKPPVSGNYALNDLITALNWIKLNIRHFGGDPEQVTILGHKQGASLATGLTLVQEARSLYHRLWLTGGSGNLDTISLEAASAQYDATVTKLCSMPDRDCLVEAEASELLSAVSENSEPWSFDDLPSNGEGKMPTYLVRDTKMIKGDKDTLLREDPLTVPIVIGVTAQADANSKNFALYDWNNTDSVDMEIEKRLGSFGVGLSAAAMKSYNVSCNWSKYISMVSDIRTVCPLNALAENFTKLYSDSFVSFYISKEDNPTESNGSGHVADSTTDISAIFGLFQEHQFGVNLQRKFYQFVKGYIQKLVPDVVVFDKTNTKFSDEKCKIWQNGTDSIVPKFGRKF